MTNNRNISFWWDTLDQSLSGRLRPQLNGELNVDVAIVGAGFTGLWTAYYLKKTKPDLEIAVIEANYVGFGASGRNGGWCSALFPTSIDKLARLHGPNKARAMQVAMHETVDEIEQVIAHENIECEWHRGGSLVFARSPLQKEKALAAISNWRSWGFDSQDYVFLTAPETQSRVKVTKNYGATFTKHVAAINPAKLVRQLALVVESKGVVIYENSPVTSIEPQLIKTKNAQIKAKQIVRATEGYTANLPGKKREIAPIYSLMIATEPLSDSIWEKIGLKDRETFSDFRNLIVYGQRTADNRFAFGGRGAPYHFGSRIKPKYDQVPKVHAQIFEILKELFPVLDGTKVTHTWGGPLGIARDWMASVNFDQQTGLATAGGYVGDGVGTSNLAGRTLADLITGTKSPLIDLPWVNHKSRNWEFEPLRWLGANFAMQAVSIADVTEDKFNRPSVIAKIVDKLTGE